MELFQFLIGRLKTTKLQYQKNYIMKFQFLIGRLKTLDPLFLVLGLVFQFLIGRLKTGNGGYIF